MTHHFSSEATQLLIQSLDHGQTPFLTVGSDSMAPLLRRGDQIKLGPASLERVAVGDIIVLGQPDELLSHRYWGALEKDNHAYLLTRGDRLAYFDPLSPADQLRAVVLARRRSGRLLDLQRGPGAWLNRGLTQLSHLETQVMQLPRPHSVTEPGLSGQYGFARRLARRAVLVLATILTALIGILSE